MTWLVFVFHGNSEECWSGSVECRGSQRLGGSSRARRKRRWKGERNSGSRPCLANERQGRMAQATLSANLFKIHDSLVV
jgi:hypothetical protein